MKDKKVLQRTRRHRKVRMKVLGTSLRPRLSVYRSNSHIYAQLIDDERGRTIAAASDCDAAFEKSQSKLRDKKTAMSRKVGTLLAKKAREKKISKVVFDRGGFLYAGRIRALAEGAREGGLLF